MARTKEDEPLQLEPAYRGLVIQRIEGAGGQGVVGEAIGVDQATVSRNLRRPSPTTMRKITDHLKLPPAIVAAVSLDHAAWCHLGARLLAERPDEFQRLLGTARRIARDHGLNPEPWDPDYRGSAMERETLRKSLAAPRLGGTRKRDRAG